MKTLLFILMSISFFAFNEPERKNLETEYSSAALTCYDTYEITVLEIIMGASSCDGLICEFLTQWQIAQAEADFRECLEETYGS